MSSPSGRRAFGTIVAAVAIVAAVGAVLAWPRLFLVIAERGHPVQVFWTAPGERFTLSWIHSVEKEAWEETFRIDGEGAISVVATRFKTFGAGVPSDVGTITRLEDGWVVMEGIERRVDPLAVQAASAESYRLRWRGREIALSTPGTAPILTFEPVVASFAGIAPAWFDAVAR
ncbi:DUF1850 domain-containing protein [Consotaella aegiceratis]|uniref:DUF1850 domain-containing protein n=1 Tax=Consotaella aegiceratis TaxID=3097961 RepID=UPI002F421658